MPRDAGRPSSRRGRREEPEEEEEFEEEERPRYVKKKDNTMMLVAVFGGVLVLLAVAAVIGIPMANKARDEQARAAAQEQQRIKDAVEAKQRAFEDAELKKKQEKDAREGPWKLTLEKVVPGMDKLFGKTSKNGRWFAKRAVANDHPEYWLVVRDKFFSDPRGEVEEAIKAVADRLAELQEEGYANAKAKGMPMKNEGPPHIWFVKDPGEGKKADVGEKVGEYNNGTITWK